MRSERQRASRNHRIDVAHPGRDDGPERPERGRRLPRREGPPRLGLQGAAVDHRGRPQARSAPLRGRDQQPRARHRHGRGRPRRTDRVAAVGRQRPPACGPGRSPGRRGLARGAVPQAPGRPRSLGGHGRADAHGWHRGAARAGQPARRTRPAGGRRHLDGHLGRRQPLRRRTTVGCVRHPPPQRVRRDAGPALRPLPQRRVRRAATSTRVGPGLRRAERATRRTATGRHERRHDPRPRAVRGLPGRREGLAGRRARRGDGLRVPGRRRVHAGHHHLAHRGHHPRPGARLARARATGSAAVLDRRHPRPARRARRCGRSVHPRGLRDDPRAGDRPGHRRRPRRVGGGQPGLADRGAEGGHPGGPPRPAARGRALPRRARRLAAGRALAVRHAGALPLGAGDRRAAARALRRGRPGDGHRRRHRAAHPRDRPGPAGRRADRLRARRARADRHHRGRRVGAVRLALPGVRGPRVAAAAPRPRSAGTAVAAAPALRAAARGRRPLPVVPDHPRDRPRGPAGPLRPAVAGGPAPAHLRASAAPRRREHPASVSVRAVAAVRLRRGVHVRGRLPHRRAPRRRAHPRPGAARRAARSRRAARAARPRGARRGRVRAPAARRGPTGPRQRGHRRPAAAARSALHRGDPGSLHHAGQGRPTGSRCWSTPAASCRC